MADGRHFENRYITNLSEKSSDFHDVIKKFKKILKSCIRHTLSSTKRILVLKQLQCCHRLNVHVHSSKVELPAAGVHLVGIISSYVSV